MSFNDFIQMFDTSVWPYVTGGVLVIAGVGAVAAKYYGYFDQNQPPVENTQEEASEEAPIICSHGDETQSEQIAAPLPVASAVKVTEEPKPLFTAIIPPHHRFVENEREAKPESKPISAFIIECANVLSQVMVGSGLIILAVGIAGLLGAAVVEPLVTLAAGAVCTGVGLAGLSLFSEKALASDAIAEELNASAVTPCVG